MVCKFQRLHFRLCVFLCILKLSSLLCGIYKHTLHGVMPSSCLYARAVYWTLSELLFHKTLNANALVLPLCSVYQALSELPFHKCFNANAFTMQIRLQYGICWWGTTAAVLERSAHLHLEIVVVRVRCWHRANSCW